MEGRFGVCSRIVSVVVLALSAAGIGDAPGAAAAVVDPDALLNEMVPVDGRYLDTRPGGSTIDGRHAGDGRLPAGGTYRLTLSGRPGVTAGAASAMVSVIAVSPAADGYLALHDCAVERPDSSNLNFSAGRTISNAALVELVSGSLCIHASAATDLVLDVIGTFDDDVALTRQGRRVDTRTDLGLAEVRAGVEYRVEELVSGIPVAGAFVVNLTVTGTASDGWVRLGPCADHLDGRAFSTVNVRGGESVSNLTVVDQQPCLLSSVDADVIIDVQGWWGHRSDLLTPGDPIPTMAVTLDPCCRSDSREPGEQRLAARTVRVVDPGDGPTDRSAMLDIVVVDPAADGYLVAYGCVDASTPPPATSTVNYRRGDVLARFAMVPRDPGDEVCLWSSAATDVVVDSIGGLARPAMGP